MGWSIGFDSNWDRDIGYGVPATCDHPGCEKKINRGLSYVCGGGPYGGDHGCGLFFCDKHLFLHDSELCFVCERCYDEEEPFEPTPDVEEWIRHKLTDPTWKEWRDENQEWVRSQLDALKEKEKQ